MLVTRLVNVRYLSGFTGSNAALLLTRERAVLATDGRYVTQAEQESPDVDRHIDRQCATALAAQAAKDGARRLLIEAHDVTVHAYEGLLKAADGTELVADAYRVEQAAPGQGRDRDRRARARPARSGTGRSHDCWRSCGRD